MRLAIVANGDINDYPAAKEKLRSCGYIIACDGGLRHTAALGITPHCLIGDMDSVPSELAGQFDGTTKAYPAQKDETDLALAIQHAIALRPESIIILGALGGRFDHALGGLHALHAALNANIPAEIWDENTAIQLCDHEITLPKEDYQHVSLIPLSSWVRGIHTRHLLYPLCAEDLPAGTTRGISNRFEADEASVFVSEGTLIIIRSKT